MAVDTMKMRYERLGRYVANNMQKRNFDAYYVPTKEEALEKAISLIPEDALVSWGGSATIREIGLTDAVKNGPYRVIDRDEAKDMAERMERMRRALLCDVFLTSSNAITEGGILINVDGGGNRVAALTFGPKEVIVVAGMNKVVPTADDGIARIRAVAAPTNMMRFVTEDTKTPCALTGRCGDCNMKDTICCHWVMTKRSMTAQRIHVILVGEELGY